MNSNTIQIPCVEFRQGQGVIETAGGEQVQVAGPLEIVGRRLCVEGKVVDVAGDLRLVEFRDGSRRWVRVAAAAA